MAIKMALSVIICLYYLSVAVSLSGVHCAHHDHPHPPLGFSTDIVAPSKKCPRGFFPAGESCVREEIKEVQLSCPKHATLEEGRCVTETWADAEAICPQGYLPKNKKCEMEESVPAVTDCPHDHTLAGNVCVHSFENPPVHRCPENFKIDHETGQCLNKLHADLLCPPDTQQSHKWCVYQEKAKPELTCKSGFELRSGNGGVENACVKTVVTSACPESHAPTSEGKCAKTTRTKAEDACPPNMVPEHHKCVLVETYLPVMKCDEGFAIQNGVCVKILERQPTPLCDEGGTLEDGLCVKKTSEKPTLICPPGATLHGHYCETIETVVPEVPCLAGSYREGSNCISTLTEELSYECHKGFHYDETNNVCVHEHTVKPKKSCPANAQLKGHFCYEAAETVLSCKMGVLDLFSKMCIGVSRVIPQFRCPKGYHTKHGSSACTTTAYASPLSVCPSDSEARGSKCVYSESVAANAACHKGYHVDSRGCVRVVQRDPEYTCPKEYKSVYGLCISRKALKESHRPSHLARHLSKQHLSAT